jgi:succinate dehydrogenase/fumarate reductase flavoprotein subunit
MRESIMEDRTEGKVKILETDVLVLGAGAAGCGAAIGAEKGGAGVLLVDKGKLESSGCLGGGNDHFMANLNTGPEWDSDEKAVNFFKGAHNGVTGSMVDKGWVKVIPIMVKFLEGIGVDFIKNSDGSYVRSVGFGQPGAWWLNIRGGQFVKRRLADKIRKMGIEVLDHVMITKLLTDGDRISAAVGFNVLDGTFYLLRAKSVVMALGNCTPRATTNSTGNPFNTWQYPYNAGSYCVLAYEAGAKVINLDVEHSVTLLPKGYGAPGMNGLNGMGAHELNALGERFMGKYDPMWENGLRRNQVLGTYQELIEGKGPPFYMDARHLSKEDLHLLQNILMVGDKETYNDYLAQKGITFATHPLEVEISEIAFGGKILMNERFESSVKGLFSGCHFFSFSGAICGGYSSGNEAAKIALSASSAAIDDGEVLREKEKIFRPLQVKAGLSPREFENAMRQVMSYYMGFVRNERGIELALERLRLIEGYMNRIEAHDYHDLMRANEARHLLKQCHLTTRAVLERRETGRTTYRRSDFPQLNPEFDNKCLAVWKEAGELKVAFEPLV